MTSNTLPYRPARLSSNGSYERVLPGVPAMALSTQELVDECHRRGLVVLDGQEPRALPGLTLEAGAQVVRWRGVEYRFGPVQGRVILALARRWPGTFTAQALALAVWGPYYDPQNARAAVGTIRAVAPGLVETVTRQGGYRLALGGEA